MCQNIAFYSLSDLSTKYFQQYRISPVAFKFGYMVTMDRISDISTFSHCDSIFKVTAGLNVSKYYICTLCPRYFMYFTSGYAVTMDRISDISTFGELRSIFKVTVGLCVLKYCILHLVLTIYFLKVFHQCCSSVDYI